MVNILLLSPMQDNQSGMYIHDSLIQLGHRVAFFDWRVVSNDSGVQGMNSKLIEVVNTLKPDLTLIIKGVGITRETIKKIRGIHPHKILGWIFDVTLGGIYLKDSPEYVDFIKELDIFYTIDNDTVKELKDLGVNAKWLSEGCYLQAHEEQIFNSIQEKKYGADIVFLGTVGGLHKNRDKFLERIWREGFYLKIYGYVEYEQGKDPNWVKDCHTGFMSINEQHSLTCGASKIVIGLDGWPDRDKSYSARLYRTLCAGGFYLMLHTKGIEENFTLGTHLDTFKTEDEMVEKLLKYLSNDGLRTKIAKAGQEEVIEKHQFKHRLEQIIEDSGVMEKFKYIKT